VAGGVVSECTGTNGSVDNASGIAKESLIAGGRVKVALCIAKESERSVGRVLKTRRSTQKRPGASGRIIVCGVEKKCSSASRSVEAACRVAPERKKTNSCIKAAARKAKKRILPLCRVASGIATIRGRTHRLHFWQKSKTDERQCDENSRSRCFESNQVNHWDSFLFPVALIL